jgi:hypothetical protein
VVESELRAAEWFTLFSFWLARSRRPENSILIIEIFDCTFTTLPPYSCVMPDVDHDACGVGFVAQVDGRASHQIVERGLEALLRLAHRGGMDADGRSGDGAGLLLPIPQAFFRARAGVELPAAFGVGMAFCGPRLPKARAVPSSKPPQRTDCKASAFVPFPPMIPSSARGHAIPSP